MTAIKKKIWRYTYCSGKYRPMEHKISQSRKMGVDEKFCRVQLNVFSLYFQINLWADFLLPLHTSHMAELGTPVLEYASPIDLYSEMKFPCLSNLNLRRKLKRKQNKENSPATIYNFDTSTSGILPTGFFSFENNVCCSKTLRSWTHNLYEDWLNKSEFYRYISNIWSHKEKIWSLSWLPNLNWYAIDKDFKTYYTTDK